MRKKPLVLAIGLLSGLNFTVNAEEPIAKPDDKLPKLSLQRCAELFPNMEQKVQAEVREEKVERLALVIGNQGYKHTEVWDPLTKTINDASAMESKFRKHDFYVLHKDDAGKNDLDRLVCRMGFILKHSPVKTAAFYYSGHGLQNIIVPTDMETAKATDSKAFSVDNIVEIMRDSHEQNPFAKKGLQRNHLVLLDSCRDSSGNGKGGKKGSKGTNGRIGDEEASGGPPTVFRPTNIVISYAAAPAQSSYEDDKAHYSFYTKALLEHLFQPSISIKSALTTIHTSVLEKTLDFIERQKKNPEVAYEYESSKPQETYIDGSVVDFYLAGQQQLNPMISN